MVLITLALGSDFHYGRQFFGPRAHCSQWQCLRGTRCWRTAGLCTRTSPQPSRTCLLFVLQSIWRDPAGVVLRPGYGDRHGVTNKVFLAIVIPFHRDTCLPNSPAVMMTLAGGSFAGGPVLSIVLLQLISPTAGNIRHCETEATYVSTTATTPVAAARIATGTKLSVGLPTYYLFGSTRFFVHNHFGHPTSLLGHYSTFGWWCYFPVVFALKTLPFLLFSVASSAGDFGCGKGPSESSIRYWLP